MKKYYINLLNKIYSLFNINRRIYLIPVINNTDSKEAVSELLKKYKEEIIWDGKKGEVTINGKKAVPYKKELWDGKKGVI